MSELFMNQCRRFWILSLLMSLSTEANVLPLVLSKGWIF